MRRKQESNYYLEIISNKWTGNFERELIGYSMGILDEVQMKECICDLTDDFDSYLISRFWREVFNKSAKNLMEEKYDYELYKNFLFETYQEVDDWDQMTFYNVGTISGTKNSYILIQLDKPLNEYWENIIVPRIKNFFIEKPSSYIEEDTKLISLTLKDSNGNVIKDYKI